MVKCGCKMGKAEGLGLPFVCPELKVVTLKKRAGYRQVYKN
jgi:hypothetical protein